MRGKRIKDTADAKHEWWIEGRRGPTIAIEKTTAT